MLRRSPRPVPLDDTSQFDNGRLRVWTFVRNLPKMDIVWDNEKIFKLIEHYHKQRFVWDISMKDYKNKAKKSEAWDNISKAMDIPRKDIENKMHTLRSQFARERKKMLSSKSAGTADSDKCKWIFYDPLKFLAGVATTTSSKMVNEKHYRSETERPLTPGTPSPPQSPPPAPSSSRKTEKRKVGDNLSEIFKIVKRAKMHTDESKDEFDIYGQYVASELRATRNEGAVLQAKSYINNILIDMRLGKYNLTHERETARTNRARQNSLRFENVEIEEFNVKSESVSDTSNSDH